MQFEVKDQGSFIKVSIWVNENEEMEALFDSVYVAQAMRDVPGHIETMFEAAIMACKAVKVDLVRFWVDDTLAFFRGPLRTVGMVIVDRPREQVVYEWRPSQK